MDANQGASPIRIGTEQKCVVDEHFVRELQSLLDEGRIPPFSVVFPHASVEHLTEDEKRGKTILQFAFLVRDGADRILLTRRVPLGPSKQRAHVQTLGDSVLIGWSPVERPRGPPYVASEEDLLWAFHHEVPRVRDSTDQELVPKFQFLGVVTNSHRDINYLYYAFEARYDGAPDISSLEKDRDDEIHGFVPADRNILSRLSGMRADLRVLEAIGLSSDQADLPPIRLVEPMPGAPPPWVDKPPGCFISHATEDDLAATGYATWMTSHGITAWYDHGSIWPGSPWFKEIERALSYSASMIVLYSEASRGSRPVADEVRRGLQRRRTQHGFPVIPVALEGSPSKRKFVPPEFHMDQIFDGRPGARTDEEQRKLLAALKAAQRTI